MDVLDESQVFQAHHSSVAELWNTNRGQLKKAHVEVVADSVIDADPTLVVHPSHIFMEDSKSHSEVGKRFEQSIQKLDSITFSGRLKIADEADVILIFPK